MIRWTDSTSLRDRGYHSILNDVASDSVSGMSIPSLCYTVNEMEGAMRYKNTDNGCTVAGNKNDGYEVFDSAGDLITWRKDYHDALAIAGSGELPLSFRYDESSLMPDLDY